MKLYTVDNYDDLLWLPNLWRYFVDILGIVWRFLVNIGVPGKTTLPKLFFLGCRLQISFMQLKITVFICPKQYYNQKENPMIVRYYKDRPICQRMPTWGPRIYGPACNYCWQILIPWRISVQKHDLEQCTHHKGTHAMVSVSRGFWCPRWSSRWIC